MTDYIAWLDLETDGADDARDGHILEVGVLITDTNFVHQETFSQVLYVSEEVLERMKPVVQDMHRATGLWEDVLASDEDISWIDRDLAARLDAYDYKLAFGGSGVGHYDKPWVKHHMPETFKYLTHWVYDVVVVRWYLTDFAGYDAVGKEKTNKGTQHRALDDAIAACEESRIYAELLREKLDV